MPRDTHRDLVSQIVSSARAVTILRLEHLLVQYVQLASTLVLDQLHVHHAWPDQRRLQDSYSVLSAMQARTQLEVRVHVRTVQSVSIRRVVRVNVHPAQQVLTRPCLVRGLVWHVMQEHTRRCQASLLARSVPVALIQASRQLLVRRAQLVHTQLQAMARVHHVHRAHTQPSQVSVYAVIVLPVNLRTLMDFRPARYVPPAQ